MAFLVALGSLALLWVSPGTASDRISLHDDFETGQLDESRWSLRRMHKRRHWIDKTYFRAGGRALAIRVKGFDLDRECGCQQNEVREANHRRLNFGDEAWYAFSFMIRGVGSPSGSQRWVIGGWKQETGGSAFLAQRFDRGIFHITLESGDTRVLLASAQGEAKSFMDVLKSGFLGPFSFLAEPARYSGESDITLTYGDDPQLPDPGNMWVDMMYRIKGGIDGNGFVEVYANGKFIVRAEGTVGVKEMGGPTQYFKMGHNRAPMPGIATLYMDNFKRGATRQEVESRPQ